MVLFPSVHRSMITLFMASNAGEDWVVHYRVLEQTGSFNKHAYIVYIAFIQIAVMNIILGIFVDKAMKNLSSESADALREHMKEERLHEAEGERVLLRHAEGVLPAAGPHGERPQAQPAGEEAARTGVRGHEVGLDALGPESVGTRWGPTARARGGTRRGRVVGASGEPPPRGQPVAEARAGP